MAGVSVTMEAGRKGCVGSLVAERGHKTASGLVRGKGSAPRRSGPSRHQRPGKAGFDQIYNLPDPRSYYRVLLELDYKTPAYAQEVFRHLVATQRERLGREGVTVLDLCCSYGVNAALLNCDLTLAALYQRYCSAELASVSTEELLSADRAFYRDRRRSSPTQVLGLDAAGNAVGYARRAGLLAGGWGEDLERAGVSDELRAGLADIDLITVTGGVGYISEHTFARVLACLADGRRPWVAAFALRWVDYMPIAQVLEGEGLVTEKLMSRTFPQRRFADSQERDYVLSELARLGVDPEGREAEGRYHAELRLSRPADEVDRKPIDELLAGVL